MQPIFKVLERRIGTKWSAHAIKRTRQWYDRRILCTYVDARICQEHETGTVGALRSVVTNPPLGRAISIGAGSGSKELRLLRAGLVDTLDIFELSEQRAASARNNFARAGCGDRLTVHVADAFVSSPTETYDLAYWDHALHHMLDVNAALDWSIRALNPGGYLLVNDYVGPTRLQWTREEVAYARRFLDNNRAELVGLDRPLRPKTYTGRLRQIWRDYSEAPQSDRILTSFTERTGSDMRPLGGAMLHLCGSYMPEDEAHPVYERLIAWDQRALADGFFHFAFGLWQKPRT